MIRQDYELGKTVSKTTEDTRLWHSEKGIVEIGIDTLAVPIMLGGQERGYVFHGNGRLLLDTVVETEEGAIGKPIEKELNRPFLMLADTEEIRQHITDADEEDLAERGYKERSEFMNKAENLLKRFFKKGDTHRPHRIGENRGFIFAFQDQNDKLDILVANGPKLVYTAKDRVFVSNKNKVVLKSPREVVCSSDGKSVIINEGRSVIIKE